MVLVAARVLVVAAHILEVHRRVDLATRLAVAGTGQDRWLIQYAVNLVDQAVDQLVDGYMDQEAANAEQYHSGEGQGAAVHQVLHSELVDMGSQILLVGDTAEEGRKEVQDENQNAHHLLLTVVQEMVVYRYDTNVAVERPHDEDPGEHVEEHPAADVPLALAAVLE